MKQLKHQIAVDDLEPGQFFTVLRNKFRIAPHPNAPESDYLKGTVLRVESVNLPYILVSAADPRKGVWNSIVDVRDHLFGRVSTEYANAVLSHCSPDQSEPGETKPTTPPEPNRILF